MSSSLASLHSLLLTAAEAQENSKGATIIRASAQPSKALEWMQRKAERKELRSAEKASLGFEEPEVLPAGVPLKKKERSVIVVGDGHFPGSLLGSIIDR